MDEYIFTQSWTPISTPPPNAARCIVTDGDVVMIATYLSGGDLARPIWMFQGLSAGAPFDVIGWMEIPRPMKKPAKYVELPSEKDKRVG